MTARSRKQEHDSSRRLFPAGLRGALAHVLVFALILTCHARPAKAEWHNLSGTLPGRISTAEKAGMIAGGAFAAGLVVFLIVKHKRGENSAKLSAPAFRFKNGVPGETGGQSVAARILVSNPGTVKAVAAEGTSGEAAIGEPVKLEIKTASTAQVPPPPTPGQVSNRFLLTSEIEAWQTRR